MDIACERKNEKDLEVYIEGDWKRILGYFGKEKVFVETVHFLKETQIISYENTGEESTYDRVLEFCNERVTVAEFKRKCKKAGLYELLDIHLENDSLEITGEFNDTFSLIFGNYAKNPVFKKWLKKALTVHQSEKLHSQLKKKKTYFSRGFSKFQTEFQAEHNQECDLPNLIINRIKVRSDRQEDLRKRLLKELFAKAPIAVIEK